LQNKQTLIHRKNPWHFVYGIMALPYKCCNTNTNCQQFLELGSSRDTREQQWHCGCICGLPKSYSMSQVHTNYICTYKSHFKRKRTPPRFTELDHIHMYELHRYIDTWYMVHATACLYQ
jgi:hypothetical protein